MIIDSLIFWTTPILFVRAVVATVLLNGLDILLIIKLNAFSHIAIIIEITAYEFITKLYLSDVLMTKLTKMEEEQSSQLQKLLVGYHSW